jgi:hypothetical protein
MQLPMRNFWEMKLKEDIRVFGTACEHLLASMAINRPLAEEEVLFIQHYCKELLDRTSEPPYSPPFTQT